MNKVKVQDILEHYDRYYQCDPPWCDTRFDVEGFVKDLKQAIEEGEMFGGTVCPECGLRQGHVHLGWLRLSEPLDMDKGVVFTYLDCDEGCGVRSLIIRAKKNDEFPELGELQEIIWKLFGKETPRGRTICPGGVT